MANAFYTSAKVAFLKADLDLETLDIRAVLIDKDEYTFSAAHDMLNDIPTDGRIALSSSLTGKVVNSDGSFDSDDAVWALVTGAELEAVALYVHTGDIATSRLIAFFDTDLTGAPLTPNGDDIRLIVDVAGWFKING